tara:strand:+ start:204 stop:359 length:156 start_codon:yes stop_codon:yes gene_type:complete
MRSGLGERAHLDVKRGPAVVHLLGRLERGGLGHGVGAHEEEESHGSGLGLK